MEYRELKSLRSFEIESMTEAVVDYGLERLAAKLSDYPFSREIFAQIFYSFSNYEEMLDCVFVTQNIGKFTVLYYDDTHYICDIEQGIFVSWYKNVGRCWNTNIARVSAPAIEAFFAEFSQAVEDMRK